MSNECLISTSSTAIINLLKNLISIVLTLFKRQNESHQPSNVFILTFQKKLQLGSELLEVVKADSSSFLQRRGFCLKPVCVHIDCTPVCGVKAGILTVAFSVRVVSRGGSSLMILARVCASWIRKDTNMTGNQTDSYFSFSRPHSECLADSANLRAAALQRAGSDVHVFLSLLSALSVLASLQGHGYEEVPKHLSVMLCGLHIFFPFA